MTRRVDEYGEWRVLDASSLDTSIEVELTPGRPISALQWNVYRDFRRDAIAIGVEALLDVLREAFKSEASFDLIAADDEEALARIADLSQLVLITCVRIGFTLRDGWFDFFESEAHRWQGCAERSPERKLGTAAMRIIADCRIRFELADRLAERGRMVVGVERAKELLRRALPCTSAELNRLAAEHRVSAKTLQRARRALRVSRHEMRDEHGRVTGYRWTSPPN
jgi:hypothetical protein